MDEIAAASNALRRVDARFLLPEFPETATVMHPAWMEGLRQTGVRIVKPGEGGRPDLVVAPAESRDAALSLGARMVLLDGRPRLGFGSDRASARRYLPIATRSGAIVIADLSHGRAAEGAVAVATHGGSIGATAKRELARALVRVRLLPPIVPMVVVHSRLSTTPALVREAARQAGLEVASWFLLAESGPDHRRLAFFLFGERGDERTVVKFSRLVDDPLKAQREARGLEAARAAGAAVLAHAPTLLAQFEMNRHHATVQTAARGQTLGRAVSGRGSREQKLGQIEAVVDWLCEIGRMTGHRRESLDADVLASIERSSDGGERERLHRVACASPAVFQHGDLGDGNVIADRASFVAVDWEMARPDGLPLWDLVGLAVCTLPLLDGALYERRAQREDEHLRQLRDLFRGRAASSAVLFRWLRSVADASGLDLAVVPEIVTLCIRLYSEQWAGWTPVERFAAEWHADPDLGMSWPIWRQSIGV